MAVIDLNDTTPAAPSGKKNVLWQADAAGTDPRHASAYVPDFTGDSGSGGVGGGVPSPAAGDAAAGKFLGAGGTWTTPGGAGTQPYDVSVFLPGILTGSNQLLLRTIPTRAVSFPASLTLSTFTANANATATKVFSFNKNGSSFGTVTVTAGGVAGTFAGAGASFNGSTDVLEVVGPASADATLANIGIVLSGLR